MGLFMLRAQHGLARDGVYAGLVAAAAVFCPARALW